MIETLKEVREALEDLKRQYGEHPDAFWDWTKARAAITKLDALIAKAEKAEPVMIYHGGCTIDCGEHGHHNMEMLKLIPAGTKLYAAPQSAAEPVVEMHEALCPALTGGRCECVNPAVVDKAWAQFCGGVGRGNDAPYPGMIEAFEAHYSQSFIDKDWRAETGVWAASWAAAKRHAAPPAQPAKPLTDEQIDDLSVAFRGGADWSEEDFDTAKLFARAIEAKIGAKP